METKEEEDKKEEAKENKEVKKIATISRLMTLWIVVAALFFVFGTFTIVSFREQRMLMFTFELSPLTLLRGERVEGWVIGNRVLETEYGKIYLGHWSKIEAYNHGIREVFSVNFQRGRAEHKLIIDEIELPREITIRINRDGHISPLALYHQEIIIFDIPLITNTIWLNPDFNLSDVVFSGLYPPEKITLADFTQIYFTMRIPRVNWRLHFHNENETWEMLAFARGDYFFVKHPSETEFQRYTSITFGQHWGNFIEGVLFEGRQ